MNLVENLTQALASLWSNKMRSLLTMLGILIGIGSVIAIFTLGDSLTGSVSESMAGLGVNNIILSLQSKEGGSRSGMMMMMDPSGGISDENLLTDAMLKDLQESFPDELQAISIENQVGNGQTTAGRLYANLSLTGANVEYASTNNLSITTGRFLSVRDIENRKKVAVVSDRLADKMFGQDPPLGKQITVTAGTHVGVYTVVGVYRYDASVMMNGQTVVDEDVVTSVFIPLSTANKITRSAGYQSVTLIPAAGVDSVTFIENATRFFDKYYSRNKSYGVYLMSYESMLDTVTDMLNMIKLVIAAIAAISLLVGGIGVMNIMMVSITERTREIGTRKAIGATNNEIRIQFIVEAMIICLIGGIIGIMLGISLGSFGAGLLGTPARASASNILLATGFSMAIGVFFGYYPANKAAKLDPIEALRYE